MITLRTDLFGLEETVTRPALIIVVSDIKQLLGLEKDIFTTYDIKDALIKKKNKEGKIEGDNTVKNDYISIEYEEESEDDNDTSLIPMRPDFFHIYRDDDLDTTIIPIYHSRKMNIKFKFATKSKGKAYALTNKLRLLTSDQGYFRRHRLEYHYVLSEYVIKLILHIYNLKYNRISDKIPFEEYLKLTFDDRLDSTNTLDGVKEKSSLVIREAQTDIPGYIDEELHNIKPEYDDGTSYYTFEFGYTFIYEKPVTLLLKYHVLVYNQIIDKMFRTFINDGWREKPDYNKPMTARIQPGHDITYIDRTSDVFRIRNNNYYITLPDFDNESLPKGEYYLNKLFSVLSIVDETDRTLLFNLDDIPKIEFKTWMLRFIVFSERKYITKKLESMFYIELFEDRSRSSIEVELLEDGTLRTKTDLDLTKTYRVVFNVINDLNLLSDIAKKRLKNYLLEHMDDYVDGNEFINTVSCKIVLAYLFLLRYDDDYINNFVDELYSINKNGGDVFAKLFNTLFREMFGKIDGSPINRKTVSRLSIIGLDAIMKEKSVRRSNDEETI